MKLIQQHIKQYHFPPEKKKQQSFGSVHIFVAQKRGIHVELPEILFQNASPYPEN